MKKLRKTVLMLLMALFVMAVPAAVSGSADGITTVTAEAATKLSTPTMSGISNTTSGVKITWKKVSKAKGYYIYRSTSKNGTYKKIATVKSGSTLSYTNKTSGTYKVSSGKTYYYKVVAYNGSTTSSKSSAKSIRYLTAGKISSLTNTTTGITVKWSKVSGAKGYYVYRKTGSGSYSKIKTISGASTVSYTDTAVKSKNGTTYTYAICPYYSSTKGSYTGKSTVRLTTPALSGAAASNCSSLAVKWSKVSSVTGYQVQYATNSSFSGATTKTYSGASTVSKTLSGLTNGNTYYTRIRTYKTVSGTKYYSAWSSAKSAKVNGSHNYTSSITTQPGCTTKGVRTYTCSTCGDSYTASIAATGHDWDDGVINLEPTCTEEGEITYTCSNCEETYTESLDALEHEYICEVTKEATCTESGTLTYTCDRCGDSFTEEIEATDHNYVEQVITEASYYVTGVTEFTCSVCGDTYTETTPATGLEDAEEAYESALTDLEEAQEALDAAEEELETAASDMEAAQAAVDDAQAAVDDAQEAVDAAQDAVDAAEADVDSAKAAQEEAQEAYDSAEELYARGAFGFFEYVGADEAIDVLENATYASYTVEGDSQDATSLDNMLAAIDWLRECNDLRTENGLDELEVTYQLIAISMSNLNYSASEYGHSYQYNVGENLAWGYSDPFDGWYDKEKEVFDAAVEAGSYDGTEFDSDTLAMLQTVVENGSISNSDLYSLSSSYSTFCSKVGHYLNIINSTYALSGTAVSQYGNYSVSYGQVFYFSGSTYGTAMTVDEYEEILNDYVNSISLDSLAADLEDAEDAVAEAEEVLQYAKADLEDAEADLEDAEELLAVAEADLEAASEAYEEAEAAAASAEAKLEEASDAVIEAEEELEKFS
ncbi:MAG: CAP domain-containing protein [Clostridiales bacterium]|nr:CAP domain-containing protein [Clostridiales bacterium]